MKQINNFERYYIDENGVIYDSKYNMRKVCQWVDNVGYYQCVLYDKNKKKFYKRVHRLVAESFIPNTENLKQVNHIDGNKLNNYKTNLEWINNKNNTQHGYDNNLYTFKTRSYPIKVYDLNYNYINTFKSIRNLCENLKLNRKTVTNILNNKKSNNYEYMFEYDESLTK